jgi:hypothetical protein
VVRAAFGGKIRREDLEDIDPETAAAGEEAIESWARGRRKQFSAIEAGVLASGVVVDDDPLLPMVFELRPFTAAHGAKKKAGPFETPLVRRAIADEQVRARNTPGEIIDVIIARFE